MDGSGCLCTRTHGPGARPVGSPHCGLCTGAGNFRERHSHQRYSSSDRGQHWVRQGRSRRGLCSVQRRQVMGQSLRRAGAEQATVSGKGQGSPCRLRARLAWLWARAAPWADAGCSLGLLSPCGNPPLPPNLWGEAAHYQ